MNQGRGMIYCLLPLSLYKLTLWLLTLILTCRKQEVVFYIKATTAPHYEDHWSSSFALRKECIRTSPKKIPFH